jgi:hypothetical protein
MTRSKSKIRVLNRSGHRIRYENYDEMGKLTSQINKINELSCLLINTRESLKTNKN